MFYIQKQELPIRQLSARILPFSAEYVLLSEDKHPYITKNWFALAKWTIKFSPWSETTFFL